MSKLAQLQARFQQKQMQEKEEKLLKLYESQQQRAIERVGRSSAGSNASNNSINSTGGGKVRQMFDERRQKAGVDKSYPLEPLKSKTTTRTSIGLSKNQNLTSQVTKSTVSKSITQIKNGNIVASKETVQKTYNNNANGTYVLNKNGFENIYDDIDSHNNLVDLMNSHNLSDSLDNEEMPQIGFNEDFKEKPLYMSGKLANVGGKLPSQMIETKPATNGVGSRCSTNKQPVKTVQKKPATKTAPSTRNSSSASSATSSQSSRSSPARSVSNMSTKQTSSSASPRAPTNTRPSAKQGAKSPVVRDDLAECRFCGRRFATDRLGKHEDICGKTGKKKRKIFDSTKHRVQGTELEGYVLKGGKKGVSSKKTSKESPLTTTHNKDKSSKHPPPKANWRRTHEEFIAAIRAAKQAQAHIAKGGKLSDLPPPPPSTNPDYVQCPHCGRRFNEAAAQRHIPKCATFEFNKPKGGAAARGRPAKR